MKTFFLIMSKQKTVYDLPWNDKNSNGKYFKKGKENRQPTKTENNEGIE